jgi:predicted nucleotidyltransferase
MTIEIPPERCLVLDLLSQSIPKNRIPRQAVVKKRAISKKRTAAPFADKIPFIRSLILDSVKPEVIKKIYLFGSYAYGKPTKNSDIDLCVVLKNNLDDTKIRINIARNLYDNGIMPVDLLFYHKKYFLNHSNPNGIENTIITEGKILHE